MEECKNMGLRVLGPDINESQKGFAVNKKGEIRFGFSGMKGVGEAAMECVIEEREKRGPYTSIYDLVKRATQRSVNKKSLESLAYAGLLIALKIFIGLNIFYCTRGYGNRPGKNNKIWKPVPGAVNKQFKYIIWRYANDRSYTS